MKDNRKYCVVFENLKELLLGFDEIAQLKCTCHILFLFYPFPEAHNSYYNTQHNDNKIKIDLKNVN